ncbi:hypothetical protein BDFG_03417 [Blastomyces dermatitidis ATCC 26199]|nr:hypothetical protein BDFG_03417 [Blastomyces dermatitidis ATCC 26199]
MCQNASGKSELTTGRSLKKPQAPETDRSVNIMYGSRGSGSARMCTLNPREQIGRTDSAEPLSLCVRPVQANIGGNLKGFHGYVTCANVRALGRRLLAAVVVGVGRADGLNLLGS